MSASSLYPNGRDKVPMVYFSAVAVLSGGGSTCRYTLADGGVFLAAHDVARGAVPEDNAVSFSGVELAQPGLVVDAPVVHLHGTMAIVHSNFHQLASAGGFPSSQPGAGGEQGV